MSTARHTVLAIYATANSSTNGPGNKPIHDTLNLHYAPLLGIDSGLRQLIVVTCIAEHA